MYTQQLLPAVRVQSTICWQSSCGQLQVFVCTPARHMYGTERRRIWPILFDRWPDRILLFFLVRVGCSLWVGVLWGVGARGVWARRGGGPNPEKVGPEGLGSPKGWGPKGWGARWVGGPEGWGAQNFVLCFLSRRKFHSFFSLWGSSRGIWSTNFGQTDFGQTDFGQLNCVGFFEINCSGFFLCVLSCRGWVEKGGAPWTQEVGVQAAGVSHNSQRARPTLPSSAGTP